MSRVLYSLYSSELPLNKEDAETISVTLSAHPQFTHSSKNTLYADTENASIKIWGNNFESVTGVYLSGDDVPNMFNSISLSSIDVNSCDANDGIDENGDIIKPSVELNFPDIEDLYTISNSEEDFPNYFINNNESITINLGSPQVTGEFDVIAANVAGYGILSKDIKKFREEIGNDTEEDTNIKIK